MSSDSSAPGTVSSAHKGSFAERFHSPIMAWIILGVSLLLTITAYFVSRHLVEQRVQDKFEFRAHEISQAIEDRLHVYEQILWGGVALFYSTPQRNVERQQWAAFVEALSIDEHWPGIQGMGYSIPFTSANKEAHEQRIRAEGFEGYHVKPEGERDEYSAIIYLEPFDWRNKRAFGYDMWSNDMRRAAMARARDEGVAATSGIITLVQETSDDVQRGFLTYVPVYEGGAVPETLAERQKTFLGWVYAPFRAANLMAGILGSSDTDIVFDIYDGLDRNSESLLYSSLATTPNKMTSSAFTKIQTVTLQGRQWMIVYRTPADFSLHDESNVPRFVALAGLVIDLLLFYVILSLHSINRRAKNLATEMTKELQGSKDALQVQVDARTEQLRLAHESLEAEVQQRTQQLQEKIHELEKINRLTSGRELRVIELKQEVNALCAELQRTPPYDIDDESNETVGSLINE